MTNRRTLMVALGAVVAWWLAGAGSASAQTGGLQPIAVHEAGLHSPFTLPADGTTAPPPESTTTPLQEKCCAADAGDESVRWNSALIQALAFTSVQHLGRMRESKTRNELGGPFLADWFESVGSLGGNWDDLGKTFTNYVAHPMGGAVYANIYRQNDPRGVELKFGDEHYGGMLLKSMMFSAIVSTQFELGPLSEASIGNVGQNDTRKMAWVDLVITPTLGVAWMAGEDAVDAFVLKRLDGSRIGVRSLVRVLLNPSRSAANLTRGKWPWYRSRDFGSGGSPPSRSP